MAKPILFIYLFFSLSIFWTYIGYPIFLLILSKFFGKAAHVDRNYFPPATIIIPTYNESVVIEGKLKDLLAQDYPEGKLQILVVDSGSTDETVDIAKRYKCHGVEVIEERERRGKGAAIKYVLRHAKFELIVITDSNSYFCLGALKFLLNNFSDASVGGVTGRYFCKDVRAADIYNSAMLFRDYENILRNYETKISSPVSLFGEIFAVRKSLLAIDENNLTEDFETSATIIRNGFRLVYEPEAQAYEYLPSSNRDLAIQRRRVIIGTIQTLCKHKSMLFNPRYGFYGLLVLPGHKLFPVLSPFFLFGFLASVIFLWKTAIVIAFCSIILIAVVLKLFKSKNSLFALFEYLLRLNIYCLLAWKDYFRGNYTVKWKKMDSSRYPLPSNTQP